MTLKIFFLEQETVNSVIVSMIHRWKEEMPVESRVTPIAGQGEPASAVQEDSTFSAAVKEG